MVIYLKKKKKQLQQIKPYILHCNFYIIWSCRPGKRCCTHKNRNFRISKSRFIRFSDYPDLCRIVNMWRTYCPKPQKPNLPNPINVISDGISFRNAVHIVPESINAPNRIFPDVFNSDKLPETTLLIGNITFTVEFTAWFPPTRWVYYSVPRFEPPSYYAELSAANYNTPGPGRQS